ncbi:MAG: DUF1015 domain-containing protein [Clostridia bacterium]|nr:DUF1015 domain-containing protein [Clostridia bacterium]
MKLYPADILLPDFSRFDGTKWSCVACDQYTSEPSYWENAAKSRTGSPSALDMILPEAFLDRSSELTARAHSYMKKYLEEGILVEHRNCGIYIERTLSDGKVRKGLVAAVDLEDYDYSKGSTSPIRPTEKTVPERIPPRLAVRRGAPLEMPHIMLLADDSENRLFERISKVPADAYSYALGENGGSIRGSFIPASEFAGINKTLCDLGKGRRSPIILAVGDGNHSLATAKAAYEEIKDRIGSEAASRHPARYCLCETVNIYDPSLEFEPIYRLLSFSGSDEERNREREKLLSAFTAWLGSVKPGKGYGRRVFRAVSSEGESVITAESCPCKLPVSALQKFLDEYASGHPVFTLDYIHGEDTLRRLSALPGCLGFIFDGMEKKDLFPAVEADGSLPRKTFSMGSANDKRYYTECRRIV